MNSINFLTIFSAITSLNMGVNTISLANNVQNFPQSIAVSEDAQVFVGAYKIDTQQCPLLLGDYTRAYISLEQGKNDPYALLLFRFYGSNDAASLFMKLGEGSGRVLGTDPEIHGEVTESWKSVMQDPMGLITRTQVSRPSIKYFAEETQLVKISDNGDLVYSVKNDWEVASCVLSPMLTRNQKNQVCDDILNFGIENHKITQKQCVQSGVFSVTENSVGQWWVIYESETLINGKTLHCEFGMDKPIGTYHPALEECELR